MVFSGFANAFGKNGPELSTQKIELTIFLPFPVYSAFVQKPSPVNAIALAPTPLKTTVWDMKMRNLKLIEAVGLLFVLGAWALEWQSVRKWNDAESDYWRFVSSYHDAVFKAKDQIQGQFEFAINRSV